MYHRAYTCILIYINSVLNRSNICRVSILLLYKCVQFCNRIILYTGNLEVRSILHCCQHIIHVLLVYKHFLNVI